VGPSVIDRYLEHHHNLLNGKCVLELGSGTGLGGIVAAAAGAARVIVTDVSEVIPLLEQNVAANPEVAQIVHVEEFDWERDFGSMAHKYPIDLVKHCAT